MLHTVNKSPFSHSTLRQCLEHLAVGAAVILIEDAVYSVVSGTGAGALIATCIGRFPVYVLGPDLEARGISGKEVIDGVVTVDYAGFVKLVVEHDAVQSWL
jgi:tRNA 2-thiouridine synthesizing protein B